MMPVILYLRISSLARTSLLDKFLTEPKLQSLSNKVFEFKFSPSLFVVCLHKHYCYVNKNTDSTKALHFQQK